MKSTPILIALADDHALLRQSLRTVLESREHFAVVIEAGNGAELIEQLNHKRVDVVLLDLEMPVMSGFEALQQITKDFPETKCLVFSYFNEIDFIMNAIKLGAKGFIPKNCTLTEFEKAILSIMSGDIYIDDEFRPLLEKNNLGQSSLLKADHPFTNKEMAIIRLICAGKTNKAISIELEIAVKTVENHRSNIFIKAGVKNVAQLVLFSIQNGIVVT